MGALSFIICLSLTRAIKQEKNKRNPNLKRRSKVFPVTNDVIMYILNPKDYTTSELLNTTGGHAGNKIHTQKSVAQTI